MSLKDEIGAVPEKNIEEKIFCKIRDTTYRNPQMFTVYGDVSLFAERLTKNILSLIDSQRCVWTLNNEEFTMSCGETVPQYDEEGVWVKDDMPPYCWHCGKRIEVQS